MKRLRLSGRQIIRAIHAACIALFFAACAGHAEAQPVFSTPYYTNNNGNVTGSGTNTFPVNAYFQDTTTITPYTVVISSGSSLSNYTFGNGNELQFDRGSVDNSGALYGHESGLVISSNGTVTNETGASISGYNADGIAMGSGNVTNSGSIYGRQNGIAITSSGYVLNNNGASISGYTGTGVTLGTGTVSNAGTISSTYAQGVLINGNGTVTNSGSIYTNTGTGSGTYIGVQITGNGTVTNLAGGTISGGYGAIAISGNGTVTNSGTISSALSTILIRGIGTVTNTATGKIGTGSEYGVIFETGGTVSNAGMITGSVQAIYNNSGALTVNNSGAITSAQFGIATRGNLTLNNSATGTITGSTGDGIVTGKEAGTVVVYPSVNILNSGAISSTSGNGIFARGNNSTITNLAGTISSTSGSGISLAGNNSVVNAQGGTISSSSGAGINVSGSNVTINGTGGAITSSSGSAIYATGSNVTVNVVHSAITSTTGSGITLAGSNSNVNSVGGSISGAVNAIDLAGPGLTGMNNTATLVGHALASGLVQGGAAVNGNVLNLDLAGLTPAQEAALKTATAPGTGTGTVTFAGTNSFGGKTYSFANLSKVNDNAISLEQVVDPGLVSVATKLDDTILGTAWDPLYAAAYSSPEAVLNQFTGREFYDAFSTVNLGIVTGFADLTDNRDFDLRHGVGGLDMSQLNVAPSSMIASLGATQASLGQMMGRAAMGSMELRSDSDTDQQTRAEEAARWGAWIAGTVTLADETATASSQSYQATTGSPSVGIDYRICPDFAIGALFNYATTGANFADGSRLGEETELGGVYATYSHGPWFADGLAGGGYSSYNNRRVAFGGATAVSQPGGDEVVANLTGGYEFKIDRWRLAPEVGLQYTHLEEDAFNESGAGMFDLNVGDQTVDSLRTKLGFRALGNYKWGFATFSPEFHADWYHECFDDSQGVNVGVSGAPALGSFVVQTNPVGRDFALVGVGLSGSPNILNEQLSFFINYDAQLGQDNYIAHAFNGGVRYDY